MNAYMVFLSVTSQWKESYMKLSRLPLISSRSFWLAQSVVLFIDTCLRRTLFFLFYRCSYLETERCQGRKRSFGLADFRFYRLLNNIRRSTKQPFCQKEELDVSAHATVFACVCFSAAFMPAVTIPLCAVHMLWAVVIDFPVFLQAPPQESKMHSFCGDLNFRFTKGNGTDLSPLKRCC